MQNEIPNGFRQLQLAIHKATCKCKDTSNVFLQYTSPAHENHIIRDILKECCEIQAGIELVDIQLLAYEITDEA